MEENLRFCPTIRKKRKKESDTHNINDFQLSTTIKKNTKWNIEIERLRTWLGLNVSENEKTSQSNFPFGRICLFCRSHFTLINILFNVLLLSLGNNLFGFITRQWQTFRQRAARTRHTTILCSRIEIVYNCMHRVHWCAAVHTLSYSHMKWNHLKRREGSKTQTQSQPQLHLQSSINTRTREQATIEKGNSILSSLT